MHTPVFRLSHLAASWGGKDNGFGLSKCCSDDPIGSFPASATTLHFEFYAEVNLPVLPGYISYNYTLYFFNLLCILYYVITRCLGSFLINSTSFLGIEKLLSSTVSVKWAIKYSLLLISINKIKFFCIFVLELSIIYLIHRFTNIFFAKLAFYIFFCRKNNMVSICISIY